VTECARTDTEDSNPGSAARSMGCPAC